MSLPLLHIRAIQVNQSQCDHRFTNTLDVSLVLSTGHKMSDISTLPFPGRNTLLEKNIDFGGGCKVTFGESADHI